MDLGRKSPSILDMPEIETNKRTDGEIFESMLDEFYPLVSVDVLNTLWKVKMLKIEDETKI